MHLAFRVGLCFEISFGGLQPVLIFATVLTVTPVYE
jgi:hypothetical protein